MLWSRATGRCSIRSASAHRSGGASRSPDERSDIRDSLSQSQPRMSLRSCGLQATSAASPKPVVLLHVLLDEAHVLVILQEGAVVVAVLAALVLAFEVVVAGRAFLVAVGAAT